MLGCSNMCIKNIMFNVISSIYNVTVRICGLEMIEDEARRSGGNAEGESKLEHAVENDVDSDVRSVVSHPVETGLISREIGDAELCSGLKRQALFCGADDKTVHYFCSEKRQVVEFKKDVDVLRQGDDGDSLYCILSGRVEVFVNEKSVGTFSQGECFGEMMLFDCLKRRSATIRTLEDCVFCEIPCESFSPYLHRGAERSPILFNLSNIMVGRLKNRDRLCRMPNKRPRVFIGSSTESASIVKDLEKSIKKAKIADVRTWTDKELFRLSHNAMESLELEICKCDFAVLVLAKDDYLVSREEEWDAPRDNVIFELGLCMGMIGRDRTFYLYDKRDVPHRTKLPSDIHGMMYIPYSLDPDDDLKEAFGKIKNNIVRLGVRK